MTLLPRTLTPEELKTLALDVMAGNRQALGRAITLMESVRADHRPAAEALLTEVLPKTGNSIRVAISGIPGAGKSTLIEKLGTDLTAKGHKVAVLAIDPSSVRSGGSILGDKTRMNALAIDPNAFIRPSPTSGTLGGVARRTRESILLCEAAGFDVILVETVGVGQSEVSAADLVDLFLLVTLAGTGDELQGIKRGILEIADLIVINKADGPGAEPARRAAQALASSLRILGASSEGLPEITCVSSLTGEGFAELERHIEEMAKSRKASGALATKRSLQLQSWFKDELASQAFELIRQHKNYQDAEPKLHAQVLTGVLSPSHAARQLIEECLK